MSCYNNTTICFERGGWYFAAPSQISKREQGAIAPLPRPTAPATRSVALRPQLPLPAAGDTSEPSSVRLPGLTRTTDAPRRRPPRLPRP
eukprot:2587591-Pleurochrysis_carterae.AAC.3